MGVTWRTPEQTAFLQELVPRYHRTIEEKKWKEFWTETFNTWFQRFPLESLSPDVIEKEGSEEKAIEQAKAKRVKVSKARNQFICIISPLIKQIKQFFKSVEEDGSSGCLNLHLEESIPRKCSEVQIYMTLYYESRIRKTVLACWAQNQIPQFKLNTTLVIPENEIAPEESPIFKDIKIPISYKNAIAQELWEKEEEAIKNHVQSQHGVEAITSMVCNTNGEERMELLHQYIK